MTGSEWDRSPEPDAVAGNVGRGDESRTTADDDDMPGLPLSIVWVDARQPPDELPVLNRDEPPPLVSGSPIDARSALPPRSLPDNVRVVYSGGPKRLGCGFDRQWQQWWADNHGLVVSVAGWCVYRYWDPVKPRNLNPAIIVMELPCLTMQGRRGRVRAAVTPAYWRLASDQSVTHLSLSLSPIGESAAYEAEVGAVGFADRWRKWKLERQ